MQVIDWNSDKAHRCPRCHTITVDSPSPWAVYTCCNCGSRFARFPRLQRVLRHVGIACDECNTRHPVPVDGAPFGFLRKRHSGRGTDRLSLFEAWLHEPDEIPDHPDGVRYINTRDSRAAAIADVAHWRSFLGRLEDDLSPVLGAVVDEQFDKWGPEVTEAQRDGFTGGSLEVYGIGVMRPHPRHGRFHADAATFTWGLIAPSGLEGIYTQQPPEALAEHAPQI